MPFDHDSVLAISPSYSAGKQAGGLGCPWSYRGRLPHNEGTVDMQLDTAQFISTPDRAITEVAL